MSEAAEFDLVAIGGGFAGLIAGLRAAELGLRAAASAVPRLSPIESSP